MILFISPTKQLTEIKKLINPAPAISDFMILPSDQSNASIIFFAISLGLVLDSFAITIAALVE